MQNWNRFPRALLVLSLLIALCAGMFAPRVEVVEAKPLGANANHIVIGEFRTRGQLGGFDEFIELYNPTNTLVDISGWTINKSGACPSSSTATMVTIPALTELQSGQHYLVTSASSTYVALANQTYPANATYAVADTGGIGLFDLSTLIDSVGMCNSTVYYEATPLTALSGVANQSYERINNGCEDTDSNSSDFLLNVSSSNPQNFSSPFTTCGYAPLSLLINEVAWAGTEASIDDEWIELYNPGSSPVDFSADPGWRLVADDGSPDIILTGTIGTGASGYYLLERGSGNATNVSENQTFTGSLGDTNEILRLRAPDGTIVDTANNDGGAWPAGIASTFSSMERVGSVADGTLSWSTYQGAGTASDAGGYLINGTPGNQNSMINITPTLTPSITPSPTNTPTPTSTLTLTPTITTTPSSIRSILINEVAWAGTISGLSEDEWIELYNPGSASVNISGWNLKSADGDPNIIIPNGVSIPAGGYYLLERDDNNTVSDIAADLLYTGTLSNSGEVLTLYDGSLKIIDTANGNGGAWPAGSSSTYGTMERVTTSTESDSAWRTNTGIKKNGKNANNGDILGTPKSSNSPTPTPTPTPEKTDTPTPVPTFRPPDPRPIINEILPRPGFDWNKDGKVDVFDEFIEIKNLTSIDISLNGWKLDDEANLGSAPFTLPNVTLKPGQRIVFYALETNILLSDGGDTARLLDPNGKIYDAYTYSIAKAEDQSICRLPDGNVYNGWFEDCIPTPNLTNSREGAVPVMPDEGYQSPVCQLPDTLPADFLFAECRGYGAGIWNTNFWDQPNTSTSRYIPQNTSKWEVIIE